MHKLCQRQDCFLLGVGKPKTPEGAGSSPASTGFALCWPMRSAGEMTLCWGSGQVPRGTPNPPEHR